MGQEKNNIETAILFQKTLDELAVKTLKTGFMDENIKNIKYNGGAEVKIPDVDTSGLADYDRETGYVKGGVNVSYETLKLTQDRGRKFYIDPMEVDESNFVATVGSVLSKFQKDYVNPEIDAYRISKLATAAMGINGDTNAKYDYTVNGDIIKEIKKGIKIIRENGANGELFIMSSYDTLEAVEEVSLGKLQSVTFNQGGIDTRVPSIDGCPIISMPSNRLYTSLKLNDGTTEGQEKGGYTKGEQSKNINFLIVEKSVPKAVTKQDIIRIFDPSIVQELNSWQLDYRRFHDLWVLKRDLGKIYVNIKESK